MIDGNNQPVKITGCWKRRSNLERKLICIFVLTAILALCLIAALVALSQKSKDPEVCVTPACIHTSSAIQNQIDESVDPCDDFYQFCCGKFIKNEIIPHDEQQTSTFNNLITVVQKQTDTVLENPVSETDIKPFKLAKTLYKACMDKTSIETEGLNTAMNLMKRLGGWPVLEGNAWNETKFDWINCFQILKALGFSGNYLFTLNIESDFKNSTRNLLTLDQANLGLLRNYLVKGLTEKMVRAYYGFMVNIAVIFGTEKSKAQIELQESLDFEMKLAEITTEPYIFNQTLDYNPTTIKDFQRSHSSIPLLKIVNMYLSPIETVNANESVNVKLPKFFDDLEKLILNTPKRVLANYLLWRSVQEITEYLNEEVRKVRFTFDSQQTGTTEPMPRWKYCVKITSNRLSIATGALYLRKYVDPEIKSKGEELVEYVREAFKDLLKNNSWMDEKTRRNALEKLNSMAKHVCFPNEMLDDKKLEDYYANLEVNDEQFLISMLNISIFHRNLDIKSLHRKVNKSDWRSLLSPTVVNAQYMLNVNAISVPAGILQGKFYDKDRPFYMNFGAIGTVIGHEFTHGFDNSGSQFDKDGNVENWWEPATQTAYLKKVQCMIEQYSNITVPEVRMNINGSYTQGENIADNGGYKEAYLAYKKWAAAHKKEPLLPGLKYNQNQLFWISTGSLWCQKRRPEWEKMSLLTDSHSPGKYRVLIPLRNIEYFSKDFKCPLGSKMNPVKKCTVW